MGEVTGAADGRLSIRCPATPPAGCALLVRDACRGADGLLSTGKPFAHKLVRYIPPPDLLPDQAMIGKTGVRPLVISAAPRRP